MMINDLVKMSKEQAESLLQLYARCRENPDKEQPTFHEFISKCYYDHINDCVMVPIWGMLIGIEKDGYIHS